MTKWFVAGLLGWVLPVSGQENALRYEAGILAPNQQNRVVAVEASGNVGLVLRPVPGGAEAAVYRRNGSGVWAEEDVLTSGEITAVALDASSEMAAVGVDNVVEVHRPSFPPNWTYFGTAGSMVLPVDEEVVGVAVDGPYAAVLAESSGSLGGDERVRMFELAGGTWSEVADFTLALLPGDLFPPRISGLALEGTRLAITGAAGDVIEIHERDAPGGAWGTVATIDGGTLGLEEFGDVALAGDRLAVTAVQAGSEVPRVEAFSRNLGGADAWGHAGTVHVAPVGIGGLRLDADGDRLVVMGLPELSLFFFGGLAEANFYGAGGGATGWAHEARRDLGRLNGFGVLSLGPTAAADLLAVTGEDAWFGLADEEYFEGAAGWAAVVHRRGGGGWGQVQLIEGPGVADGLGKSLSMENGVLAVGMPDDSWMGAETGSVMLWWVAVSGQEGGQAMVPLGRITSPSPQAGERFGASVAVFAGGDGFFPADVVVAVGAPGRNGGAGAAYVFEPGLSGNSAGMALEPAEGLAAGDAFGSSVAVGGGTEADWIGVGSPGDDDAASNAGAVFVFERDLGGVDAWGRRAKRTRPAGVSGTGFGTKMSGFEDDGDFLLATRPPVLGSPGQVAVFGRDEGGADAWGVDAVIEAPAGSPPGFGASVDGGFFSMAIGATGNAGGTGKAYVYSHGTSGWTQLLEAAGTATEGPSFGSEVAVSYLHLCVGSPAAGGGNGRLSVWGQRGPILADWGLLYHQSGSSGEGLGSAVGSWIIYGAAGAPGSNFSGPGNGQVVVNRAGSYEVWAKSHEPSILPRWKPEQDADEDGQANLIEFALESDPTSAASRGIFALERGVYHPTTTADPAMVWMVPDPAYATTFLDLKVEVSPTLESWTTAEYEGASTERYYLTGGALRRFYRLSPLYPWFDSPSGGGGGGVIELGE